MIEWTALLAATFAALTATAFSIYYTLIASWWISHMGRSIMLLSVTCAGVAWITTFRRLDELYWHETARPALVIAQTVMWVGIGLVFVYRILAMHVLNKNNRDEK